MPVPLALKEEVNKAVAESQKQVNAEVGQLRAELAEVKTKLGGELGAMNAKWTNAYDSMNKKVDGAAVQLQELRTVMSQLDLTSAVSSALASALPAALSTALAESSTVPSPLRKKGKGPNDEEDL